MAMRPDISYTPYDKSSWEKTGDIITFTQFEEGVYYPKTTTIKKAVTNLMTIQICHH